MGGLGFLTGLSRVSIRVAYLSWSITGPYCSARKHITELGSFDGAQGVSRFRGARNTVVSMSTHRLDACKLSGLVFWGLLFEIKCWMAG